MKKIEWLTIHASATPPSMDIGAEEIDQWHLNNGWNGIGYHYVTRHNGSVKKIHSTHVLHYNDTFQPSINT